MNFYDQALALSALTLTGLLGIIAYDLYAKRRERFVAVRKKALGEAAESIASLHRIAEKVATDLRGERPSFIQREALKKTEDRAYYYGRAAQIVASIPVDRL